MSIIKPCPKVWTSLKPKPKLILTELQGSKAMDMDNKPNTN